MARLSLADVNRLILSDFAEVWEYSPIVWDLHNSHADIDKTIDSSEKKIIASPYVEFQLVEPLEIPVTLAMRRVVLSLNVLTAELEGRGNKSTLDAVDAMTSLYSQTTKRLKKPDSSDFVTLDFGEVAMGSAENMAGKYIGVISASCTTYF